MGKLSEYKTTNQIEKSNHSNRKMDKRGVNRPLTKEGIQMAGQWEKKYSFISHQGHVG